MTGVITATNQTIIQPLNIADTQKIVAPGKVVFFHVAWYVGNALETNNVIRRREYFSNNEHFL